MALAGEDRFGVELHALDVEFPVTEPHDQPGVTSSSSHQAVTSRQSGRLSRSTTSE